MYKRQYASAATLYEVGYNHFFRGPDHPDGADAVYIQGHSAPGAYARAYVEGRLNADQIHNFRRELADGGGLSSYPHPWLMKDFWQFPSVSMGLGSIMGIYQARFMQYLHNRDLIDSSARKVWVFLGDGEMDEPEALGAISLAARARLDNLIFVINCNLQRLDGPVRGNGKIIQELERAFRGTGLNVIKVLWGEDWDPLFAKVAPEFDQFLSVRTVYDHQNCATTYQEPFRDILDGSGWWGVHLGLTYSAIVMLGSTFGVRIHFWRKWLPRLDTVL